MALSKKGMIAAEFEEKITFIINIMNIMLLSDPNLQTLRIRTSLRPNCWFQHLETNQQTFSSHSPSLNSMTIREAR